MRFNKIQNKGQAQIFRNKFLETLTKAHPLVIWSMYIPFIGYMLYYSKTSIRYSSLHIILSFSGAVFFWTLFEYLAHRYIFQCNAWHISCMVIIIIIPGIKKGFSCRRFSVCLLLLLYLPYSIALWKTTRLCFFPALFPGILCIRVCTPLFMPGDRLLNGWRPSGADQPAIYHSAGFHKKNYVLL